MSGCRYPFKGVILIRVCSHPSIQEEKEFFQMKHERLFATLALPLLAAAPIVVQAADVREMHPTIIVRDGPFLSAPSGFTPAQLQTAYGFDKISNQGKGQIIGIVDAFDDPNIETDLGTFSTQFKLPACTTANGCFKKVYATGTAPKSNFNWDTEISLDVEWSHAMAPQATIMLVEAAGQSDKDLYDAVDVAVKMGANVVSMSWGGKETKTEVNDDVHFNVTGVTFLVASGDTGHGAFYPAASPFVVGVGGTALTATSTGVWESETAWSCTSKSSCSENGGGGSGGGASVYEPEPSYQAGAQNSGKRGIPDVAYDADPTTGVSLCIYGLWLPVGGTSMAAPQWASLMAIANSMRVAAGKSTLNQPQNTIYQSASDLHDITTGSNGTCGAKCKAKAGYDFITGLGSPKANVLIPALVAAN
jgi:subtilase family serine protease